MAIRIIFNGQEYASIEAMPESVRRAYLETLTMLRDADADGIPDALETGRSDAVIGVQQSSITLNGVELAGGGTLPTIVRRLLESAMRQGGGSPVSSTTVHEPPGNDASEEPDTAQRVTWLLWAFLAGFIVVFSVGLMFALGGGRDHLAGRFTVAIPALLLLGWLDTYATRLANRRRPLLGPDPAWYRRFVVWSASGFLLAAALLLGLAWLLP